MPNRRRWSLRIAVVLCISLSLLCVIAFSLDSTKADSKRVVQNSSVESAEAEEEVIDPNEEAELDKLVLPIPPAWVGDFDGMKKVKNVRMLVPYSKTFFFVDRGGKLGIDYDYGRALEKWLNKKYPVNKGQRPFSVMFIPVKRDQLLQYLIDGKGDIAAGGLTITPERSLDVDFTLPYIVDMKEVLVTAKDFPTVQCLEDLAGKEVTVRASSSYFERLTNINKQFLEKGLKPIKINSADEWLEAEDLMEMVDAGIIQATVVDRYLAYIWQPLYTEMQIHESFFMNESIDIAWAIRKDSPKLAKVLNSFMKEHKIGTTFGNILKKRYLNGSNRVRNTTSVKEVEKFNVLVKLFKKHGKTYDFDYLMLMAQGYQESMLNQKARSHKGAVGIMQMLPSTAADPSINIKGIAKDASKNIEAGAKYLRFLTDRYLNEDELTTVNRTLLAFAAYNAGPGNLRKFRKLAEKSGYDRNVWFQNVEYAAARIVGQETVKYVANIYKYYLAYKLVETMQEQKSQPLTTAAD